MSVAAQGGLVEVAKQGQNAQGAHLPAAWRKMKLCSALSRCIARGCAGSLAASSLPSSHFPALEKRVVITVGNVIVYYFI